MYVSIHTICTLLLGCPGPLALVFFSTTSSAIVQPPYIMVLTVASTSTVLLAKLTGPVKLNPSSLPFAKGNPSLSDHHQKNKNTCPEARTMGSLISLQDHLETCLQLMNQSMCGKVGAHSPYPKVTLLGCSSMSDLHGWGHHSNVQVIEIIWMAIRWIV